MQSRNLFLPQLLLQYSLLITIIFIGFGESDITEDRAKCEKILFNLIPCNTFVTNGGDQTPPTSSCCSALKIVLQETPVCLCILVKDRNDPTLADLKLNATLALGLPDRCNLPTDVNKCPELLHLAPNSPDAQVFNDIANSHKGSNGTAAPPQAQGGKSGGFGKIKRLRMEMVLGGMITVMSSIFF